MIQKLRKLLSRRQPSSPTSVSTEVSSAGVSFAPSTTQNQILLVFLFIATVIIASTLLALAANRQVFALDVDKYASNPCLVKDSNYKTSSGGYITLHFDCSSKTDGIKLTWDANAERESGNKGRFISAAKSVRSSGNSSIQFKFGYTPNSTLVSVNQQPFGQDHPPMRNIPIHDPQKEEQEKQAAGQSAAGNALVAAVPADLKDAFNTKRCASETGADKVLCQRGNDTAWKMALGECDQQAVRAIARLQTGSASQATINASYKSNFATCLATKTGKPKNSIEGKLPNNLLETRSKAEKEGRDSVVSPADEQEGEESSCAIDGVGWFVCPSMGFVGGLMDTMFDFIAGNFLEVSSSTISDDATRKAWGIMRNIANIAFVIAFLVIIYSQITGAGIGNYGVKKLLPRIIITAILVNLSFFIGQLAVDISNLLGYSLKQVFESITASVSSGFSGSGWAITIGAVLAAGVGIGLAFSVPVLLAALLAVFMIMLILVLRKALILLLIVISPLAFVAFLLPNTEQWFKKWYKMFFSLLMVFPVISVVFGASLLAANIIQGAPAANGSIERIMTDITALGVSVIPFFVVPSLLKGSLNATGALGTKLSGMSGKATARVGKKAMTQSRLGDVVKDQKYKSAVRQANRRAGNGLIARTGRNLGENGSNKFTRGLGKTAAFMGGGGMNALDKSRLGSAIGLGAGADNAQVAVDEMFEKDVKAAALSQNELTVQDKKDLARGYRIDPTSGNREIIKATKAQKTAAMDSVMASGGFSDRREMLEHAAASGDKSVQARAIKAAYAAGDGNIYGKQFGDKILSGDITDAESLAASAVDNAVSGKLQGDHLMQSGSATSYISDAIYKSATSSDPKKAAHGAAADANFVKAAKAARDSEHAGIKMDDEIDKTFRSHGVN